MCWWVHNSVTTLKAIEFNTLNFLLDWISCPREGAGNIHPACNLLSLIAWSIRNSPTVLMYCIWLPPLWEQFGMLNKIEYTTYDLGIPLLDISDATEILAQTYQKTFHRNIIQNHPKLLETTQIFMKIEWTNKLWSYISHTIRCDAVQQRKWINYS